MSDDGSLPRRRRVEPRWLQALRGLGLVTGLALAVGLVGLLVAWLATLLA